MTTQQVLDFFNKWNNRFCDYDKNYGPQCKDVFSQFNHDLVKAPYITGNPVDMWPKYLKDKTMQKYYQRIPNSLTFVPKLGDVAIFAVTKGNPYGHIGICTSAANILWFTIFQQNDPLKSPCHYKAYNYLYPKLLGVLRPKV